MNLKSFECPKSIRNYEKNNAWNIRHLVAWSQGQTNQQTSVLYYKLKSKSIRKSDIVHCAQGWWQ